MRLVQGGTFTPILWDLPVGHRMRMIGPKGKFMLQPDDDRTHLFISSGTGNAPFVSMMRQALARRPRRGGPSSSTACRTRATWATATLLEGWQASGRVPGHVHPDRLAPERPAQRRLDGPDRPRRDDRRAGHRRARAATRRHDRLPLRQPGHDPGRRGRRSSSSASPRTTVHKELYWPKGKEPRGAAGADLAAAIDAAEANADQ